MESPGLDTSHKHAGSPDAPLPLLWRRPWWLEVQWLTLAWLSAVVYGTLIPFDFRFSPAIEEAHGFFSALCAWITSPRWNLGDDGNTGDALGDLVVNLALFMPLGGLLVRTLNRWGVRNRRAIVIAALFMLVLAWCIESTQSLVPQRVASAHDVLLNVAGGLVGALLGPQFYELVRTAVFWLYRHSAPTWFSLGEFLRAQRRRPWLMLVLVSVNIGVIIAWYVATTPTTVHAGAGRVSWMPFLRQFQLPYTSAAMWIGRSLMVYFLVGTLMAMLMLHGRVTNALLRLMFAVTVVAAVAEQLRRWHAGDAGDATEPVLAGLAAAMVLSTATLLIHLLRTSCRRRAPEPTDNDRRRRPHNYDFALRR